jgi:hypothetical protein
MIFRREPIHKRLAREAGLESDDRPSEAEPALPEEEELAPKPGPRWGLSGMDGVPRPRRWDTVVTTEAPAVKGDEVHFVALSGGEVVTLEEEPAGAVASLVEPVDAALRRPYRAEAVRRDGDTWAVAASRIQVATFDAPGDELELVGNPEGEQLTIDGERVFGSVGELELIGARQGRSYVVRARRLEGRLWEVESNPL